MHLRKQEHVTLACFFTKARQCVIVSPQTIPTGSKANLSRRARDACPLSLPVNQADIPTDNLQIVGQITTNDTLVAVCLLR
ncbi:hypothetical protein AVEN_133466-1, partial [Araneus ventricosus]